MAKPTSWWHRLLGRARSRRIPDTEPNIEMDGKDIYRELTGTRMDGWQVTPPREKETIDLTTEPPILRLQPPAELPPKDRLAPHILRGRVGEFSLLANSITLMPVPIIVIEGPAGVGKSSLLDAASHYAYNQGFLDADLDLTSIRDQVTFIRALRQSMEPQLQHGTKPPAEVRNGLDRFVQNVSRFHWEESPDLICQQAVGLAQDCGFLGILLTIDEAQKWLEEYPLEAPVPAFPRQLLRFLNDKNTKASNKVPILCIIAGIHGAVEAVSRILSPRHATQTNLQLTNLHPTAIAQSINDRLNFSSKGVVPAAIPADLLQEVVQQAQGYPAHAINLADTLIPHALAATRANHTHIQAEQYPQIHIDLDRCLNQYYLANARRLLYKDTADMYTFAYLQQRARGPLLMQEVNNAIRFRLSQKNQTQPDHITEAQIEQERNRLCRRNIITEVHQQHRNPSESEDTIAHYYVTPAPSFTRYTLNATQKTNPELHEHYIQIAQQLLPKTRPPLAMYYPPENPIVTEYETIRTPPRWPQNPERGLQPILECDVADTRLTANDIKQISATDSVPLPELSRHTTNDGRIEPLVASTRSLKSLPHATDTPHQPATSLTHESDPKKTNEDCTD